MAPNENNCLKCGVVIPNCQELCVSCEDKEKEFEANQKKLAEKGGLI